MAANGGVLDLAGLSITVPSFSGASGVVTTSVAQSVALTVSQTGSTVFGGSLQNGAGVLSLVFSGGSSGLLDLSGVNTYSGSTQILAGTLQLGSNTALSSTGALAVNSGGLLDMNGFSAGIGALNGSGTVDNVAGYETSVLTLGNGGNGGSFSGTIQNSSPNGKLALVKVGSGTQILSGTNTYTGGTTLSGGTLNFAASAVPLAAGSITFNGGTLQYASGNTQDVSSSIAPIAAGQAAAVDTNGNSVAFGSGLSGTGGLTKLGAGLLTLNGSNSYLGTTRVAGGTLQLGTSNPNALPGGAVTANGGFLDLNGNSPAISSLNGAAGTITNSSNTQATLTLNQTTPTTFGGTLQDGSGGLNVTMNGPGMLTLAGVNTYSYSTTINAGVLRRVPPCVRAPIQRLCHWRHAGRHELAAVDLLALRWLRRGEPGDRQRLDDQRRRQRLLRRHAEPFRRHGGRRATDYVWNEHVQRQLYDGRPQRHSVVGKLPAVQHERAAVAGRVRPADRGSGPRPAATGASVPGARPAPNGPGQTAILNNAVAASSPVNVVLDVPVTVGDWGWELRIPRAPRDSASRQPAPTL